MSGDGWRDNIAGFYQFQIFVKAIETAIFVIGFLRRFELPLAFPLLR